MIFAFIIAGSCRRLLWAVSHNPQGHSSQPMLILLLPDARVSLCWKGSLTGSFDLFSADFPIGPFILKLFEYFAQNLFFLYSCGSHSMNFICFFLTLRSVLVFSAFSIRTDSQAVACSAASIPVGILSYLAARFLLRSEIPSSRKYPFAKAKQLMVFSQNR